jgi:serine/threonine protein phosphatase PrpC
MLEQWKTAYSESRRVRTFVSLCLAAAGLLLYTLTGGFPPWAWRFLLRVLPQLPHLWASQRSAIIVPLMGLVLLSLSLLILWLLLIFAAYRIVLYWWHHLHEHEHFAMDLREAERIAEDVVSGHGMQEDEYERWQPSAPTLPVQASRPEPVRARQPSYAGMRGSRVVGSSGLIRVPSAVFSDDTPFPGPAPSQPLEPRSAPVRPAARVPQEPRTMPMSVPTQAMPRVAQEPRMQLPQSMQATQPNLRQGVGRIASLTAPSAVPGPITMREQLHIVPRIIDDESDTIPIVPSTRDIAVRDTLPDNDLVEIEEVDDDDMEGDIEEELSFPENQDTLTDVDLSTPGDEPLRLLVGIGLDAGITRKDVPNEDNLFAIQGMRPTSTGPEPVGLFIVADGMGGHAHGQEASKLAVQAISDAIVPTLMRQVDNDEVFSDLLKDGVHRANLAIYRRNREQEHMMGTTLTAVLVVAQTAYVVNVGDSRTYLYRAGLEQVTRDHSVVARLMEDGVIAREDIYTHPKRNQIYRCLGEHASVEVDTFVRTLQADDVLVLCSDGLWEMVHDDEMESIVASSNSYPSQLSKMLIQAALMRGGVDNISVIVACMAQTDTG